MYLRTYTHVQQVALTVPLLNELTDIQCATHYGVATGNGPKNTNLMAIAHQKEVTLCIAQCKGIVATAGMCQLMVLYAVSACNWLYLPHIATILPVIRTITYMTSYLQ